MLEAAAPPIDAKRPKLLLRALRALLGYVLAVAAGSVIFALLFPIAVPDMLPPHDFREWLDQTWGMTVTTFILGFLFGLPYTALGLIAFRHLLPRNMLVFLIVGTLFPAAAIATMGLLFGGFAHWIDAEKLRIMVFTLPSGFIAAYIFGAIGLGLGFRSWRFL